MCSFRVYKAEVRGYRVCGQVIQVCRHRIRVHCVVIGNFKGGSQVRGYCVCVSGRPTLLSRTELSTLSSRQVATKQSGAELVKKLFPKDAAYWTEDHNTALTLAEGQE